MGVLLAVLAATIGLGSLLIGTAIAWLWDVQRKVVAAIALGNIPEGLGGTVPIKKAGRGPGYAFGLWGAIAATSIAIAMLSALLLGAAGDEVAAVAQAFGGGALLAMVANAMLPEAYEIEHRATGLFAAGGFLVAF